MKPSKTELPCDCPLLEMWAHDPEIPIVFDERMGEYHIVHSDGKGMLVIYHCPFCGGKAPESKRGSFFTKVSRAEIDRLSQITKPLKTVDELIAALGPPDRDIEKGSMEIRPEKDGKPEETVAYRTVQYNSLSETANVQARITPDGRVAGFTYLGKSISPPKEEK